MRVSVAAVVCVVGFVVAGSCGLPEPAFAGRNDACVQVVVGVDAIEADTWVSNYLGRAAGQSFFASDTLIRSISVWRVANEGVPYWCGLHPYVVEVDSTGMPITTAIVGEGFDLSIPEHDGINPTEFRWTFDPPLALPHRGMFAFLVQVPLSQCGCVIDMLAAERPEVADGVCLWLTYRSAIDNCYLRPHPERFADGDMVYHIEFCHDASTRTARRTWGQLKLLYR